MYTGGWTACTLCVLLHAMHMRGAARDDSRIDGPPVKEFDTAMRSACIQPAMHRTDSIVRLLICAPVALASSHCPASLPLLLFPSSSAIVRCSTNFACIVIAVLLLQSLIVEDADFQGLLRVLNTNVN